MKTLLVLVVLVALLPLDAGAGSGAVWEKDRVRVFDHSAAEWQPLVQDAVARYNILLPKKAPRLIYVPMEEMACPKGIAAGWHRVGITVCMTEGIIEKASPSFSGRTVFRYASLQDRTIKSVTLQIDTYILDMPDLGLVCHELMHATTGAPHFAWSAGPPCPYDPAFAKRVYKKLDHGSGPRGRAGGKHR